MSNTVIKCDVTSSVLNNKKQCWRRKAERGKRRKAERETQKKEEDRRTMKRQQKTKEEGEADRRRKIQEE